MVFVREKSIDHSALIVGNDYIEESEKNKENRPCFKPTFDGAILIIIFAALVVTHSAIFFGDAIAALLTLLKREREETENGLLIITICEYILTAVMSMLTAVFQLEHNIDSLKALMSQNKMLKRRKHWGLIQLASIVSLAMFTGLAYSFNAQHFWTGQLFLVSSVVHMSVSILTLIFVRLEWI